MSPGIIGRFDQVFGQLGLVGVFRLVGQLRLTVEQAEGRLVEIDDPETFTRLFLGAMTRGAMLIANSAHPRKTRDQVSQMLRRMLYSLVR